MQAPVAAGAGLPPIQVTACSSPSAISRPLKCLLPVAWLGRRIVTLENDEEAPAALASASSGVVSSEN
jgi:hypothetical protein